MKIYQIICISHKNGITGDIHFEKMAASDGITDDEMREFQGIFHPSEETGTYPAYSFFKLKGGRYCVCMAKSPTGDGADFFCHGLILDEGYWPFYPVQLIGSSAFKYGIEEDFEGSKLPVLEVIEPGNAADCDRVSEFARTRLQNGVRDMIGAVVEFKKCHHHISVVDSNENIPLWIGAVQMAFPVRMAHNITFATSPYYTNYDDCMMKASGTDHNPLYRYGQDYIFDYMRGIKGKPGVNPKFLRIVSMGYIGSRKTLESFHRFLDQFGEIEIDEEIDGCYDLFMMVNFRKGNMSSRDIMWAFDFTMKHGSQEILDDIFQMLEPSLDRIVRVVDMDAAESTAGFMFKTALNSKKLILMDRVCYFFYNMIDHLVFDYKVPDVEDIFRLFKQTAEYCGDRAHSFFRYSVSRDRINYMANLLSGKCTPERAEICIMMVLESFIRLGYMWDNALHIDGVPVLMNLCVTSIVDNGMDVSRVLQVSLSEGSFFAKMAMMFYNRIKQESGANSFTKAFASTMAELEGDEAAFVRRLIYDMEGGKLLFEEYSILLNEASDKVLFFNHYMNDVFERVPGYDKKYFDDAVKMYIKSLEDEHVYGESLRFLKGIIENRIVLSDEALTYIIKGFEKHVPLSSPSEDIRCIIPSIKKIKRSRDIITFPDIAGMVDFAVNLENIKGEPYIFEEIIQEFPETGRVDEERYKEYVRWCLPLIIALSKNPEHHRDIARIFGAEDVTVQFYSYYLRCIEDIIKSDRQAGTDILLQFCIYFFFYLEPRYKILEQTELFEEIKNIIAEVFLRQPKSIIQYVDSGIRDEFERRALSLPLQWGQVYKDVMHKKRKQLIKNITGIFRRS